MIRKFTRKNGRVLHGPIRDKNFRMLGVTVPHVRWSHQCII